MSDEFYIKRCLELAQLGIGKVSPNPMVGCVIVVNDQVIGEGYHQEYGQAHAEPNAIQAVILKYGHQAADLLKQATVYVSLEPCAHFGKTPPCADLLIKQGIKKLVIANVDPFSAVDGKGIAKIKAAGIEVKTDVLKAEAWDLNRRFFTKVLKQRPYIILKWAQTANGFMGSNLPEQKWITGTLAKQLSHQWRSEEDAILVGKNTALIDNPSLTTRNWSGKNPVRLLIDKNLEVPLTHQIYNSESKTIVFNEVKTTVENNVHYIQMEDMHFYLPQKLAYQLYILDIQSVIIEGGANILNQFISANLWDEARVFTANTYWENGILAPKINSSPYQSTEINNDQLAIYRNDINL